VKRGFTLIELLFSIVIIALLAAIAIPNFIKLKDSALASNFVKTTLDAINNAAIAAVNLQDIEGNTSFKLKDILVVQGKYWSYDPTKSDGEYDYDTPKGRAAYVKLRISERAIYYKIVCDKLPTEDSREKCKKLYSGDSTEQVLNY
jgi:prepilin-type N-terminal cleavage/methylation domain-containing protein